MNRSILIELLGKFNPKEIKEFGEFVHSPFFNKNEGVIKLYNYIRTQYPDFPEKKVEKKYVYAKIFPNVEYNDGFMRTLMFNLCALAENFLSYLRYKNSYFFDKNLLLHELNDRELNRLFERNIKSISKQLSDKEIKDADYFYNKYYIDYEYFHYLARTNLDKIEKIVKKSDAENMFDNLTYFYLIHVMNHYTYFLNVMELYRFNFDTGMFDELIKILKPEVYEEIPSVGICYNVLMLFIKEDDVSYFYKTKELLSKHGDELNRHQVHNAYMNLKNYCKRRIQKGDNSFIEQLFGIYKIEITAKIYPMQNEMSFRYYTDVVETALKLKEYKWTEEFIEKYKNELSPGSQENTYQYSHALYEFAMKNFEKSLELLSKVTYNDVYHKMKYRSMLLMIYYELDYGDLLLSHLDAFNHFLINDALISDERKIYYSNFIKYVRNLSGLRDKDDEHGKDCLKIKITDETKVYNKEWLLEKLNEIIT